MLGCGFSALANPCDTCPLRDPLTDSLTTLPDGLRSEALRRFNILHPHLSDGVPLTDVARMSEVPLRSLQRWAARYHRDGFVGLARAPRSDAGRRKMPSELVALIEGLALHKPKLSAAAIHRRITPIANARNWPVPSYATVHAKVHRMRDEEGRRLTEIAQLFRVSVKTVRRA